MIKDSLKSQKKLKKLFDDYTIKTSEITARETKKELKKNFEKLLKSKDLKLIEPILPEALPKPIKPKLEPEKQPFRFKPEDLEKKELDLKANRDKVREDIKKVIKSKPKVITNPEKLYNNTLAGKELKDFQDDVRTRILEYMQENPSATVRQIKDKIKEASTAFIDRRIEVIARTEGTKIANRRRLEEFGQSKIVQGVEFLAVLDNRTTQICSKRHREQFKLGTIELAMNTPPLHFNCRSILSPITIFEEFKPIELEVYNNLPPVQKGFSTP
jgi:SPP1 gp7 family putative phage head morphogenesis protein